MCDMPRSLPAEYLAAFFNGGLPTDYAAYQFQECVGKRTSAFRVHVSPTPPHHPLPTTRFRAGSPVLST